MPARLISYCNFYWSPHRCEL